MSIAPSTASERAWLAFLSWRRQIVRLLRERGLSYEEIRTVLNFDTEAEIARAGAALDSRLLGTSEQGPCPLCTGAPLDGNQAHLCAGHTLWFDELPPPVLIAPESVPIPRSDCSICRNHQALALAAAEPTRGVSYEDRVPPFCAFHTRHRLKPSTR